MGTYSKIILSGSTDGQGIKVTGTAPSKGTTVHTAVTGAAQSLDEVWIYGYNAATTAREISLAIGPTTATASQYSYLLPTTVPDGLHLLSPGLVVRNAKVVRAFATADSGVHVFGYVNRFAS
jgi:hypothetical protein